eukprot:279443-Hanusia_phi.AAC.3
MVLFSVACPFDAKFRPVRYIIPSPSPLGLKPSSTLCKKIILLSTPPPPLRPSLPPPSHPLPPLSPRSLLLSFLPPLAFPTLPPLRHLDRIAGRVEQVLHDERGVDEPPVAYLLCYVT